MKKRRRKQMEKKIEWYSGVLWAALLRLQRELLATIDRIEAIEKGKRNA